MENTLKILETVNQFYIDSFNQLIMITVMILTFIGVLMPILISLYQKRIFKLEQQEIKNSILETVTLNLKEIEKKIDEKYSKKEKEYENKILNLEQEMERQSLKSLAKILHLQGNSYLNNQHYYVALDSFLTAGKNYLITKEETGIKRILILINQCLENLNKSTLNDDSDINEKYEELIQTLETHNEYNRYIDEIKLLKKNYKIALSREA